MHELPEIQLSEAGDVCRSRIATVGVVRARLPLPLCGIDALTVCQARCQTFNPRRLLSMLRTPRTRAIICISRGSSD